MIRTARTRSKWRKSLRCSKTVWQHCFVCTRPFWNFLMMSAKVSESRWSVRPTCCKTTRAPARWRTRQLSTSIRSSCKLGVQAWRHLSLRQRPDTVCRVSGKRSAHWLWTERRPSARARCAPSVCAPPGAVLPSSSFGAPSWHTARRTNLSPVHVPVPQSTVDPGNRLSAQTQISPALEQSSSPPAPVCRLFVEFLVPAIRSHHPLDCTGILYHSVGRRCGAVRSGEQQPHNDAQMAVSSLKSWRSSWPRKRQLHADRSIVSALSDSGVAIHPTPVGMLWWDLLRHNAVVRLRPTFSTTVLLRTLLHGS